MKRLTDSYVITKILMNEVFNNILSNNIFNKKRNKCILFIILTIVYISYYILNISQLNQIFISEDQSSNFMKNNLFSSLTNVIIIISGFIYLIVTITFSLTNRMHYQLKILPFENGSIWMGSIFFKLILSYGSFLIIFAIIVPLLKLFYFSLALSLLVFLYCQLLFFCSLSFFYFMFYVISKKMELTYFNINNGLLVILLFFYLFVLRFRIDQKFQEMNVIIDIPFMLLLIITLILFTIVFSLAIYYSNIKSEGIYSSSEFYLFKIPIKMDHLSLIFLGIIRNKLTLKLTGIVIVFFALSLFDTKDFLTALTTLAFIYPIISFTGIRYYSTTMSYRKMNPFFGITPMKETFITLFINVIINAPLIFTAILLSGDYVKTTYYGFIIFESALIMSIIFPKNKSSVNEFSASILCAVLAISLYLISNSFLIFSLIFLLMTSVKYYLIKRSFYDEIN
ncbi:membrane protein [Gracilibacillus halophilus YIM-C55.5]|uniref:Membrane protein n=1 Tax=Gracilibacillus halophilus YIM-C55.5 TaxID=1308866 RepID=N4WPZ5_9BACI|nr:membrane protein [Gracilibacillus halophilus YIM-C55.5]